VAMNMIPLWAILRMEYHQARLGTIYPKIGYAQIVRCQKKILNKNTYCEVRFYFY